MLRRLLFHRHGKKWDVFRAQVQQVMLSANAAKKYIGPLDEIADDFLTRIDEMLDEKKELPGNLLHELYKWALECKSLNISSNSID